jgi:uncharacterized protein (TIGR02391 family)
MPPARLEELQALKPEAIADFDTEGERISHKIEATLIDVFRQDTIEFDRYSIAPSLFTIWVTGGVPRGESLRWFRDALQSARSKLETAIEILEERLQDAAPSGPLRALKAYEGLALHPQIEEAASGLFRDGRYANAILDAVKALNNLVRLRSGEESDGTQLMERVFAPKNPILRFNEFADQSDTDEQRGFMMMFSGAVAGLRNPRAHKFIEDDPERALEFIAFISLLAKLLDKAKKVAQPR